MQRFMTIFTLSGIILACVAPAQPFTSEFSEVFTEHQIRWPSRTIKVGLSTSLSSPGPNMKPGSDVVGAARRALARWSSISGIKFLVVSSKAQSIGSDGVNLITIADTTENSDAFASGDNNGRTRVFYNQETGEISEADIVINPHPVSADGSPVQFSTDGTLGTYDLESTFTHEIGHLLGLEHSGVVAATMQARQALNGVYNLPAFTPRTLSEDDRAAVRRVYGPHAGLGAIEGRILTSSGGGPTAAVYGAYVWAEESTTGRVISSSITQSGGNYRIESLSPGQYRVLAAYPDGSIVAKEVAASGGSYGGITSQPAFWASELTNKVGVTPDATTTVNAILVPPQNTTPSLRPRLIGLNGQLSTTALPLDAGKRYTLYIGGEGVDQVPGTGITVTSPLIVVDPGSLRLEQFNTRFPVISFEVNVAANTQFGDYSIRLQLNTGETVYLAGSITIDPGVDFIAPNPADEARFFVRQHYRDSLGREPETAGLDYWANQITQCGSDAACVHARHMVVSGAFFTGAEFQETSAFVYRVYKSSLGRGPSFAEFSADRSRVVSGSDLEASKQALTLKFVQRSQFLQRYPAGLKAHQFVKTLLETVAKNSRVDLSAQEGALITLYNNKDDGRAAIIRRVAEDATFAKAEYNQTFVLMQYFCYLRRDPDQEGYEFWLNVLDGKVPNDPTGYRSMLCAFITSEEYQLRFGMLVTHTNLECGP